MLSADRPTPIFSRRKYWDCEACAPASCWSCCCRRICLASDDARTTADIPITSGRFCADAMRSSYAATIRALRYAWNLSMQSPHQGAYLRGGGGLAPAPSPWRWIFVLIFNVKKYAKFWTLLKMYTWNLPPGIPPFRFLNMPLHHTP